jgi:hypothetical protein
MLHGVLDRPVPQPILNEPGGGALVGHGEAAGMPQHVWVGAQGQARGTVFLQKQVDA